jgi:ABC-type sulfate transport system permease component
MFSVAAQARYRSRTKPRLLRLSWAWRITIGYLLVMLVLPVSAMLVKASSQSLLSFGGLLLARSRSRLMM